MMTDVADQAGIRFVHHAGASGNKWYSELFGGGVAVLDLDGDAWPDLLFVNGKDWPPGSASARHGRSGGRATSNEASPRDRLRSCSSV